MNTTIQTGPQNNFKPQGTGQPPTPSQQPSGDDKRTQDLVELRGKANVATRAFAKVAGFVTGIGMGLSGLITNGCAGGAHGLVRGAGVTSDKAKEGLFQAGFAVNLAVAGYIVGGPNAALGNLVQGEAMYHAQPDEMKANTQAAAENWTDGVTAHIPGGESTGAAKFGNRIASAAAGEVVGFAAGALVGVSQGFPTGMKAGELATLRLFVGRKNEASSGD